ncbi:hypothetical protein ABZ527_33970 [Streptomyces griseofuscus]|uniref:hypothetical protein n=1 Tax=Streptomyces griseofuscus TaxID=146922 RepID=UPI0033FA495C
MAEAALRKAAELLPDGGTGDGAEPAQQAVQEALRAFLARRSWAGRPEQEKQIPAMVRELRTVRQMDRPGAGLLRRRRQG